MSGKPTIEPMDDAGFSMNVLMEGEDLCAMIRRACPTGTLATSPPMTEGSRIARETRDKAIEGIQKSFEKVMATIPAPVPVQSAEWDPDAFSAALIKAITTGDDSDWQVQVERHHDLRVELRLLDLLCVFPVIAMAKKGRQRQRQLEALEARVAGLESRPVSGVQWAGVWDAAKSYTSGQLVTRSGGLWLALSGSTGERPGTSPCWRLVVKGGADRPVGER